MIKALLILALVLFPAPTRRGEVIGLWNRFAATTGRETEADLALHKSLKDFNPQYLAGPYEPRKALLDEAIRLSEERTRLLREMREAGFGR